MRPIKPIDIYRRYYQLGLRASSGNFLREIVAAAPPKAAASRAAALPSADELRARLADDPVLGENHSSGSNAYGIGSQGARGVRSLVLGNPHFPWQGSERLYEMHLTVPGKLDAIGAALQGVPAVNIGFNSTSRGATRSPPRAASRRTSSSSSRATRRATSSTARP